MGPSALFLLSGQPARDEWRGLLLCGLVSKQHRCCCFSFFFLWSKHTRTVNRTRRNLTSLLSCTSPPSPFTPLLQTHPNHVHSIQAAEEQAGQGRGHRCQDHRGYPRLQKQAACPLALLAWNHFSVSDPPLPLMATSPLTV